MLRLAFAASYLVGTTMAITTDTNLRKETVENGLAMQKLEVDAAGAMMAVGAGVRSLVRRRGRESTRCCDRRRTSDRSGVIQSLPETY